MSQILFLIGDVRHAVNDNHQRLPQCFRQAGWTVTVLDHTSVHLRASQPMAASHRLSDFNLIWSLGFGVQATFLDRMQILKQVDQTKLVNSVDSYMYLHGKYAFSDLMPETHAHHDAQALIEIIETGGTWVIKPSAGSYGRDVHKLTNTEEGRQIVRQVTGANGYCLLQRYLPAIQNGEKRVLLGNGKHIGHYLRKPGDGFLANLNTGGTAELCDLSDAEERLAADIGLRLHDQGVRFAAVDLVYPYLLEINVVNPGGLGTIEGLTGCDPTPGLVEALVTQ